MLTNQHSYTNPRHVEPIEEGLDGGINLQTLTLSFPFKNTLSHGSYNTVVSPLDVLQSLGEAFIVIIQFWRPISVVVRWSIVSSAHGGAFTVAVAIQQGRGRRPILSFTDARVLGCFGEDPRSASVEPPRTKQTSLDFLGQSRSGEVNDFLHYHMSVIHPRTNSREYESYLERLCVPVLDLLDRWHFTESIWKFSKILNTMSEAYWEFFGKEL